MNSHSDDVADSTSNTELSSQTDNTIPEGVNRYLHNPEEGMKLCAELITRSNHDQPHHELLDRINLIIDEEFLALAGEDENDTSTKTYAALLDLKQRLIELVSFPVLEKCYTVAIGGAFSAGKSRFLNSVLGCPSLLPTDTTPTTSIPTYISQGSCNQITALNAYQKKTTIDEEALGAICHAFNEKFGVTFSHLLQLISVEREHLAYPSLAFLDTPGYSKADNISRRSDNTDENIARQQLSAADYLIWLVDLQSGTIPKPDLDFIAGLDIDQPVLIIFSKADKKPESQVHDIIATGKRDLERAELPYHDVIAYSAQTNQEISDSGNVLSNMLNSINNSKRGSSVIWQAERLLSQHINDYQTKKQSLKLTMGTLNELLFDDSIQESNKQHLENIQQKTRAQSNSLTQHEKQAKDIQKRLVETLEELCEMFQLEAVQNPAKVQLTSAGKTSVNSSQSNDPLTFDGLLRGDTALLANVHDLKTLEGSIEKISPVGVTIKSSQGFEILLTKMQINRQLSKADFEKYFQIDHSVEIQIVSGNKCNIHISPISNI